jgi:hypothetical protein
VVTVAMTDIPGAGYLHLGLLDVNVCIDNAKGILAPALLHRNAENILIVPDSVDMQK